MRRPAAVAVTLLAAAALVLPPLAGASGYAVTVGISFLAFAVLATGLNLVYGYIGLLSFAQVAFWAIGAYSAALLVVERGWAFLPAVAAGGLLALAAGIVVSYAALRLSRHSFAIVTLSFALLSQLVARDWVELTRGPAGIPGLPAPILLLPGLGAVAIDTPVAFYWLMLAYAVVALAFVHRLVRSRIGRTMLAIRLDEALAQAQGIDPLRYKLLAIGLSALLSGIAGGIFVFHLTIVDPSILDFYYTETMLIMVIVGGRGSFWGVLAAAAVFAVVPEALRAAPELRMVLYGAVLVAAMLAFPEGVGGWLRRRRVARWRRLA
ncbi:MAG: branched-chain amino acid ABC transporter permease [Alphaproteobacteria bacterium]|nr:branched-chain amino acid ABC transporter permease [Alphaproteobacteria bacterium]